MFSFRRKPSKTEESPRIRTSPSLPTLTSQGIPWPENLVDADAMRQVPSSPQDDILPHGPKASLQADRAPIPFHKPFRAAPGTPHEGPISSLYTTGVPPEFNRKSSAPTASRYSQRRARIPPTFNLMVVGGKGTGKTSLLRLLLETADISPTATVDQKVLLQRFLRGSPKATPAIETACVEILESRFDRVLLSVIDTPGLDFIPGRELKLERQVNSIIRYVDVQYADTMSEESKVVRKSKGDQHIHLCIYMIDPSSIMTSSARRGDSAMPTKTRSETTVSYNNPPDLVPDTSSEDGDSDDEGQEALTMSPAEVRVIRRLSARANVLPVIARADSLTDEKLLAVKNAVRTGLTEAGLDFGVFSPPKKTADAQTPRRQTRFADESQNGHVNGNGNGNGHTEDSAEAEEEEDEDEERQSRPVIKLRARPDRGLSRSRSRRDLSIAADDDRRPISPDAESLANVRFSAHIVAKTDISSLMPFALIAPEMGKNARRRMSMDTQLSTPSSPIQQSEDGHAPSIEGTIPGTPIGNRGLAYLQSPPEDLKGVFVRKFRWGTVDILDPNHCDFAALRTAVLSTHLKVLKNHTKEVLYEKYRTEKLLARRATANITDDERQRLLEDLGL